MRHQPGSRRRSLTRRAVVAAAIVAAVATGCGSDDGADPEAFCASAEGVASDPVLYPELSTEQLDRLASVYQDMADTAPGSVRDDVDFLNDAVHKLQEGDVSFAVDEEQAARLAAAFEGVSDYVREECP